MDLSSWNLLANFKGKNKQFAVIGLGRFGRSVCETLHGSGCEVLAIDREEKKVNQVVLDKIASHAVELDSTEPDALKQAGIPEFETVIVAIGNYLAESITTTLNLKELKVKFVVAKASSETHVKLLKKVGADRVVFPEREMGTELGLWLTKPKILDRFEIDPENSIVEVVIPEEFDGKTIIDLELRKKYGLNLLAVSGQDEKFEINPLPNKPLVKGRSMVVLGSNNNINRLPD